MPPKSIDGWTLVKLIRRSGQAEVYEATKGEGEPIRALKLIRTKNPQKRARFIQEVRKHLELSIKHAPNIIPIIDHNLDEFERGEQEGYIVMPLAATTLDEQVPLLSFRAELCLEVFRGIVSGIQEAHAVGIIHRDLKPPNVLFEDQSLRNPLVSDFGICFVKGTPDEDRLTGVRETVGAKFFMAPEQERGGKIEVTESADVYALGKLLHFILTGRHLYRENLEEAFERAEVQTDPRLAIIRDQILARTIVLEPGRRVQTGRELIEIVDKVRHGFGGPVPPPSTEARPVDEPRLDVQVSGPRPSQGIAEVFNHSVATLDEGKLRSVKLSFDRALTDFSNTWTQIHKSIDSPAQAPQAARDLIESQSLATGLTLAMGRLDAKELFHDFRRLLESVTRSSAAEPGYRAINAVPHVLAGFLYSAANVAALHFQSWDVLQLLLRTKFEWFYQSERPLYSLGFDHSHFFHAEALGRKASESHDLFRAVLSRSEILKILGVSKEDLFNAYLQAHLIMCLRAAQEIEAGEHVGMFADFGRFYDWRIIPLLDRMYSNPEIAKDFCQKVFQETRDEWFSRLNARLKIIRSEFFGSSAFLWESISSYEPRK